MQSARGAFVGTFLVILMCAPLLTVASSSATVTSPASSSPQQPAAAVKGPVFVWLYGYVGDYFYPQTNLSLTPQNLIDVAANLSRAVGSSHLRLVAPVDEEPGHNIQPQMISTIKSYVDSLKPYSSVIYGRLDLLEFNSTTRVSLYTEVSLYYNQLDLNGVWFDHSPLVYLRMGQQAFSNMIQNLTNSFPGIHYIMDQSANLHVYVTPAKGSTWGRSTYICPTVQRGTLTGINLKVISKLNAIYPGRVLLHYDAFAKDPYSPMSYFANQSSRADIRAVDYLVRLGTHPPMKSEFFYLIFPVIGSWTCTCSKYSGTLYNGLDIGTYARFTIANFTVAMRKS